MEVAKAKQNMDLPDNDLRSTDNGCPLTDGVIDCYLFKTYGNSVEKVTLILTTLAFFNMQDRLKGVYSKCYWDVDNQFATYRQILIPVHIESLQHWILVRVSNFLEPTCLIQVYDPMNAPGLFDEVDLIHKYFKRSIANSEHYGSTQEVDIQCRKDIPQQSKGSQDCGVYVLHYIEHLRFSESGDCPIPDFNVKRYRDKIKEKLWYLT